MVVLDPFIGPAIGLAGSLFGSSGPSAGDRQRAQSAFEAQNAQIVAQLEALDAQKDVDRARYSRALAEWEYSKGEAMKQYYYEVAQLELLKEIDAQRGIDQMDFNRKLIQAAGEGFELQAEQLEQQFITAENIRAEQQALDYDYQQTRLGIETSRQVAQYMAEVDRNTAQMDQVMAATTNRGKSVQNQIILEHSVDTFQYHAGLITAAIQSAAEENTAITVSGGSEAAKRIASDRIKEAYRQMGVVELRARGRRASLEQQNQLMQSETAAQALNLSIQSERYAQAISEQTDLYGNEYNFRESIFKDVTIPSFELSSNDYIRELKGLELETEAILDQATLPYRAARYQDVLEPSLGLKPEFLAPETVYTPAVPTPPTGGGSRSFLDYAGAAVNSLVPYANDLYQGIFNSPQGFGSPQQSFNFSNVTTPAFNAGSSFGNFSFSPPTIDYGQRAFSSGLSFGGSTNTSNFSTGFTLDLDLGF